MNNDKANSKVYKGISLIFEHFKVREQKLIHALYDYMSVRDIAKILGVTEKFIYSNYGSVSDVKASKQSK
jgi:cytoplasmic iron level regulating protein YaaA (DUF328/UPF0246 family)